VSIIRNKMDHFQKNFQVLSFSLFVDSTGSNSTCYHLLAAIALAVFTNKLREKLRKKNKIVRGDKSDCLGSFSPIAGVTSYANSVCCFHSSKVSLPSQNLIFLLCNRSRESIDDNNFWPFLYSPCVIGVPTTNLIHINTCTSV
jgi:hypothetical protein